MTFWWLLPILGVLVGYVDQLGGAVDDLRAGRAAAVGPAALQGLFIRRQHEVAEVYARIVADEILTVSEFGDELLNGPRSDRTRALIERSMRPAIDRATGPARAAVRVAMGTQEYEAIRQLVRHRARRPHDGPRSPTRSSAQPERGDAALITERMRAMAPRDFAEMLRTATEEDEWLLLLHGAVLGLAGGLIHLAIFG